MASFPSTFISPFLSLFLTHLFSSILEFPYQPCKTLLVDKQCSAALKEYKTPSLTNVSLSFVTYSDSSILFFSWQTIYPRENDIKKRQNTLIKTAGRPPTKIEASLFQKQEGKNKTVCVYINILWHFNRIPTQAQKFQSSTYVTKAM